MGSTLRAERTRTRLEGLASSGLDAAGFVEAAIDLLGEAVPHSAAGIATGDPATRPLTSVVKCGLSDEHDDLWSRIEYEEDDVAKLVDLADRAAPVALVASESGGDVLSSTRIRELMIPHYSISHELRAACVVDGAMWGALCLFRDDGAGGGFNEAEAEFLATVVGAFGAGMRLGILATAAGASTEVPGGPSVVIVDGSDRPVQVSVDAERMFHHLGWGDWQTWGALPQPVSSLVGSARSHGRGVYPHPPRLRLRSAAGVWFVAHASLLAGRDGERSSVVITIEEARPPEIVPLVVAAYGLTPREQDVVRMVLQGVDTAEIARTLHLSSYTVQDHLKSIFAKAGVRSRRELTARVYFEQYAPRLGQALAPSGWFAPSAPAAGS